VGEGRRAWPALGVSDFQSLNPIAGAGLPPLI